MFFEHITKTGIGMLRIEPSWVETIFHSMEILALTLLILHFVKAYVVRLGHCSICKREIQFMGEIQK